MNGAPGVAVVIWRVGLKGSSVVLGWRVWRVLRLRYASLRMTEFGWVGVEGRQTNTV